MAEAITKHPLYKTWAKIKERCFSVNCPAYPRYGGRGVTMQGSWRKDFREFAKYVGDKPEGLTLERIDNDKDYCEGNVQWATYAEQARNKSMYKNNTTGVTGVNLVEKKPGKWYYIAVWEKLDGKQTNRVFSVDKYGEKEAFKLACETREREIALLKSYGIYSGKHGEKRKVMNEV